MFKPSNMDRLWRQDKMAKLVQLTKVLDWEDLLEKLSKENEECIVKKGEEPVAVVIPYVLYQNLKSKASRRERAWEKLNQVMEKVGKRHEAIPEEEVEKDALEAIKAIRSEQHA